MGKFAAAISFVIDAKDYEEVEKVAHQIGSYVLQEDASVEKYNIIDVEFLEDDEALDDLDFDDDED